MPLDILTYPLLSSGNDDGRTGNSGGIGNAPTSTSSLDSGEPADLDIVGGLVDVFRKDAEACRSAFAMLVRRCRSAIDDFCERSSVGDSRSLGDSTSRAIIGKDEVRLAVGELVMGWGNLSSPISRSALPALATLALGGKIS